jgi:hypothetical protein
MNLSEVSSCTNTCEENGLIHNGAQGSPPGDMMDSNIEDQMDSQASDEFRPPFRSALDNVNHDEKYTLTSVGNVQHVSSKITARLRRVAFLSTCWS